MKKLVVVLVVLIGLLVAGWAGATLMFSNSTEQVVDAVLAEVNESVDRLGFIEVEKSAYRKGFRSSTATTTIRTGAKDGGDDKPVQLNHQIYHGPFALTPDGAKLCQAYSVSTFDKGILGEDELAKMKEFFGDAEPIVIRTTLTLEGTETVEIVVAAGGVENDEMKTEFGGLRALMHIDPNNDEITGKFSVAPLSVTAKTGNGTMKSQPSEGSFVFSKHGRSSADFVIGVTNFDFEQGRMELGETKGRLEYEEDQRVLLDLRLGKMVMNYSEFGEEMDVHWDGLNILFDYALIEEGSKLMVGKAELHAPLLKVNSDGGSILIADLKAGLESGDEGGKLFGRAYYGVGSVQLQGPQFSGPEMAGVTKLLAGGGGVELGVRGIDRGTAEDLAGEFETIEGALKQANGDPAAIQAAIGPDLAVKLVEGGMNLIQPGFGVFYNTNIGANGEGVDIGLALGVKGEKKLLEMETGRDIVGAIEGEVKATMSKSMMEVEMMRMMAGQYAEMGFLAEDGAGGLKMDGKLKDGVFTLGGEATPLIESLGPLLDGPIPWDKFREGLREGVSDLPDSFKGDSDPEV